MNSNNTLYLLAGIGIGAVVGVLFAPKSGPETRDFLKSKSAEGASYVKQTAGDAIDLAKRKAGELSQNVAETIDKAAQTVKAAMES
jgi:gas vesicle protein